MQKILLLAAALTVISSLSTTTVAEDNTVLLTKTFSDSQASYSVHIDNGSIQVLPSKTQTAHFNVYLKPICVEKQSSYDEIPNVNLKSACQLNKENFTIQTSKVDGKTLLTLNQQVYIEQNWQVFLPVQASLDIRARQGKADIQVVSGDLDVGIVSGDVNLITSPTQYKNMKIIALAGNIYSQSKHVSSTDYNPNMVSLSNHIDIPGSGDANIKVIVATGDINVKESEYY
ncbi:hypothetical protein H0A36_27700 [Endozoicomonas sp. SM1973]|uniref:Adhesin domain-containing protein n=1 Tax=Spartinivicinus marinus TaxID=2994442 RepID=A0A853IIA7_9GAMM|nr:hypothetical protein [Spartinivicinus marinus]MCX4030486.1 hypothetical protein [Spartinivicinus marinus]NYZ69801.1 hypothetical protein [Spartinivicinus marinus]